MKKARFAVPILLVLMLVACATTQEKWKALTPDEQARIVIDDLQGQIDNAWSGCKAYVDANPKYHDQWIKTINPAFSAANKALASVMAIGKTKPITPAFVYEQVQKQLTNALTLATQIGWIKK